MRSETGAPPDPLDVPVLIVGGGPVGMAASILLAQHGVRNLVVERRREPESAPAAHVVNARSFEILRAAGVDAAAIGAACKDPADAGSTRWVTTLAGDEWGALPFEQQGEDMLALTPTPLRNLSQHRLEPILRAHLEQRSHGAAFWPGHQWESAEEDADGATSQVRDLASGSLRTIRSRYVLAADGAGSRVRKATGIEMTGPARLRSFVMIHFEANLRRLVGDRPGVLYWTTAPDATGTFVAHDIDSTWVYMHGWDPEQESADRYDEATCAEIVRRALGVEQFPFTIRNIRTWHMSVQIASRYRDGRTFLVGDAAHRFPPTGGLGLNTGVQDVHNLAWKLAAVESGLAQPSLLDTYEAERRPVAVENADVSARNAMRLLEVYQALGEGGDGSKVRAAIANQAEHFDMLGLQLGFHYEAGALVPDGTARPAVANPVREYVPTGRPGARLPHTWITRDGAGISSLDLVAHDRFTLIIGAAGKEWAEAAASIAAPRIACFAIGDAIPDPGGVFARQLGIEPDGAVLLRPDQHVAWRSRCGVANPRDALHAAVAAVLGH